MLAGCPIIRMSRMRLFFALIPIALFGLAACTPARGSVTRPPEPMSGAEAAQQDSARLPWTEADVRFMTHMIGHHAQAVKISLWAPTHTPDQSIRTLAARIINAQRDEITLMRNWLLDRGRPAPSVDSMGTVTQPTDPTDEHAGHDMGGGHSMMAGMLSPAQLEELDAARGEAFDILYLQRMISHHRGAVTMVQELLGSRGAAIDETVFRLAADVETDQSTEIRRMLQMLLEKGGIPPA